MQVNPMLAENAKDEMLYRYFLASLNKNLDVLLPIILLISITGFTIVFRDKIFKRKWKVPTAPMSTFSKEILSKKVPYYTKLSSNEKVEFEYRIKEFLLNVDLTGIDTTIEETDKLLIASSAIIPIFHFKDWRYQNLDEVLIYPNAFDRSFNTKGKGRSILGMVGSGPMEGKMILSKSALRRGFSNESDKKNTAIHEFIHLIDKSDGVTDGIPKLLLERQYTIPWFDLMNRKMSEIQRKKSDINSYGATSQIEFFAVASEYFFERPELLAKKHPKLFSSLSLIFTKNKN